jgi:hypothetical protein
MHVPSYPRAVALLLMLASLAGVAGRAQAVEFDEKLMAPMVSEPVALRTQAQSYIAKFNTLRDASPREVVTSRALSAERFDLTWQIQQAIDMKRPLGDLSAIGLERQEDGSYRVDYNASPQWNRPDELFTIVFSGIDWPGFGAHLVSRGFREADVASLKSYVSTHDLQQTNRRESLPLALSFSAIVKKYDKIKRPVDDAVVLSYIYQREKLKAENGREWVEGLLNSLDAQRARILLTHFSEFQSTALWAPSDQRAGIDYQLQLVRLPNYEQLATAEATGDVP